jgi:hypothetical protein
MKTFIFTCSLLFCMSAFSQEEIADKVYLYGNVRYKLQSQVLIKFPEADPKTELKTIKYFEERGVNAVSWNALFLPGADYSGLYKSQEHLLVLVHMRLPTILVLHTRALRVTHLQCPCSFLFTLIQMILSCQLVY